MYTYTDPYASYGEGAWSEASYAYSQGPGGNPYYYPNSYDYYGQEAYGGEQYNYQGCQYYAQEASYPGQHQYYQDQECLIQTVSCDNTANGQVVRNEVHYVYYFNYQYGTYVFSHTYQTNTVLGKDEEDVSPRIVEVDVSKDDGCAKDPIAACMYSKTKKPDLLQLEWRQEENLSFNEELDSSEPSQDQVTGASDNVNVALEKPKEHPLLESEIFASATELDDEKDGESSIQEVADIASDNASKMKSLMMHPSLESAQMFAELEPSDNDSTLPDAVDDFVHTVEKPMLESTDVQISTAVEFVDNNVSSDAEDERVNDTDASKMKSFLTHPSLETVLTFELLEPSASTHPEVVEDFEHTVEKPMLESTDVQISPAVEFNDSNVSSDFEERVNYDTDTSKMKLFMTHPSLEAVNTFELLEPSADSALPKEVEDFEHTVEKPILESTDVQTSPAVEFDNDGNSALNPEEHTVVSAPVEEEQSVESCKPTGWRKYLRKLTVFTSAACQEIATCYIKGMLL